MWQDPKSGDAGGVALWLLSGMGSVCKPVFNWTEQPAWYQLLDAVASKVRIAKLSPALLCI